MKRLELLQERYEDALFALLMENVAISEGQKAWKENERLKNDPGAEILEAVDKRCLQTIRRYFTKQTARRVGHYTVGAFKRVMMVAGLAAVLFTCAFASSETVRRNTLNLVIEVFNESTDFYFTGESVEVTPTLKVGWVPEGYELEKQEESGPNLWYQYRKSEDEFIRFRYSTISNGVISMDTEDADVRYVEVNGNQAMLIQRESKFQVAWSVYDNAGLITITSEGIPEDELLYAASQLAY